jgi:hypothetical protein
LALLLGREGVALLRAFAGDGFDRPFVEARIAEVRALLAAGHTTPWMMARGNGRTVVHG